MATTLGYESWENHTGACAAGRRAGSRPPGAGAWNQSEDAPPDRSRSLESCVCEQLIQSDAAFGLLCPTGLGTSVLPAKFAGFPANEADKQATENKG
jgi:hypothetical protein